MSLYEKSRKISNYFVIGFVVLFAFLAILAIHGDLNPKYPFIPAEYNTGALLGTITNTGQINSTFTDKLGLQVVFTTTSLSAQNDISVDAKIYPPKDTFIDPNQWKYVFPEHFYLFFPNAIDVNSSKINEGLYYMGTVRLDKSLSPQEYHGTKIIKYQFGGIYNFSLADQKTMDAHTLPNGVRVFDTDDLNKLSVKYSNMQVGSSDATTTLYVGSIGISLTFVLIGFGVVETRDHINSIVIWFLRDVTPSINAWFRRFQDDEGTENQGEGENSETDEHD